MFLRARLCRRIRYSRAQTTLGKGGFPMKKLISIYNKLEEYFLVYTMILMVIIVFIQVIFRYILNDSLSWSEELVRYIFIWQVWLGASLGMRINEHIRVDMFVKLLPNVPQKILGILTDLLVLAFYIFLIVYGFKYLQNVIAKDMTSTALKIPLAYVYASLPVGSVIIALRYAVLAVRETVGLFRGSDDDFNEKGGIEA